MKLNIIHYRFTLPAAHFTIKQSIKYAVKFEHWKPFIFCLLSIYTFYLGTEVAQTYVASFQIFERDWEGSRKERGKDAVEVKRRKRDGRERRGDT